MLKTGVRCVSPKALLGRARTLRGTRRLPAQCSPARTARQAPRIVGHILPSTGRLQPPSVLRINRKQRFFHFPHPFSQPPSFASVSVSLSGRRGGEGDYGWVRWFSNITRNLPETMGGEWVLGASPIQPKFQDWPKPLGLMGQTSLIHRPASTTYSLCAVPTSSSHLWNGEVGINSPALLWGFYHIIFIKVGNRAQGHNNDE